VAFHGDTDHPMVFTGPVTVTPPPREEQKPVTPTPSLPLHQLPSPPRDFTGRKGELAELLAHVERGATISGVRGMGGVGKTALALKLAEQLAPRYPDAQFFIPMGGTDPQPLSPAEAMARVIRAYHPEARLPDNVDALCGIYRSVLHDQRALLLLDNAADDKQVSPLIPPASCLLLVTTRRRFALPGLRALNLDLMSPEDAQALLLEIAPRIGKDAPEMAARCGRLPIALRLAASALAERPDLGVAAYLRGLRDAAKRLELVAATLETSYALLDEELQRRWCALSVFPESFDMQGAAALWEVEPEAAQNALGNLLRYSMLDWDEMRERYRLHDLARDYADGHLAVGERGALQAQHAAHYLQVLSAAQELYKQGGNDVLAGLTLFDKEWANIRAGQAWAAAHAGEDDGAATLCAAYPSAGIYCLVLRLHPREQIAWLKQALHAARQIGDRRGEGIHLGNLGVAYNTLGDARRAIAHYEQQLVIAREIGDRQEESNALGNLGLARADLGDARRAIAYYEQSLAIDREIGDRRGEGNALGNLGLARADLGDTRRAIEYYEQALAIDREIGDRRGEGLDLGNLGIAYYRLGDAQRAIAYHEQALIIAREIGDRRGEGNDLWNMGLALESLGERERAIDLAEQALAIREQIEDPNAEMVRRALAEWRGEKES